MSIWKRFGEILEELFFPDAGRCPVCGREGGFCENCRTQLSALYAGGAAVFYYDGIVKDLIHRLKFGDQPWLAKFMAEQMIDAIPIEEEVIVTAVPLHKKRRRQRGYNQSEEIAREFARRKNLSYAELLRRVRDTRPQSLIREKTERLSNVRDAFIPIKNDLTGKHILLIDDVVTTGATIEECRQALFRADAASVTCISFARGKNHGNSKNTAEKSTRKG